MADFFARALRYRLHDEETSFTQRLRLGKKVMQCKKISDRISHSQKSQVVLEWIIESLKNHIKQPVHGKTFNKLWKAFSTVLNSLPKNKYGTIDFHFCLHSDLLQLLNESLKNFAELQEPTKSYVLGSCSMLVNCPALLDCHSRNIETYMVLIASVMNLILSQSSNEVYEVKFQDLLMQIINQRNMVLRRQVDPVKVFEECVEVLLKPAAKLITYYEAASVWPAVMTSLMNLIGNCLFQTDLQHHFINVLQSVLGTDLLQSVPEFLKKFFLVLKESSCLQVEIGISAVLPHLFSAFLKQYIDMPKEKSFYFFIVILRLLGIELPILQESFLNNHDLFKARFIGTENKLSVLANIIKVVSRHFNIGSVDNEFAIEPVTILQNLTDVLLNNVEIRSRPWYICFHDLLAINPLIITPKIRLIFEKAWVEAGRVDLDSSLCQAQLFCEIVEVYGRLHQISKLISIILKVTSSGRCSSKSMENLNFPAGVTQKFGEIFLHLSPSQTISILSTLCNHILTKCIPMMTNATDGTQHFATRVVYPPIELLSTLLCYARLIDVNIPKGGINTLVDFSYSVSKSCIPQIILGALKSKDVSLLSISLFLAHCWGELHLALLYYNRKYSEIWAGLPHVKVPCSAPFTDLSYVHSYIGSHEWDLIFRVVTNVNEATLQYVHALLVIQNIKAISLFGGEPNKSEFAHQKSSAGYIVSLGSVGNEMSNWNGQISSLDDKNIHVATWNLLCSNLSYIVPYLSAEEISHVAKILVLTFNEKSTLENGQKNCTVDFIKSPKFQELLVLQSAVVTTILESILSCFCLKNKENETDDLFIKTLEELLKTLVLNPNVWMSLADSKPDFGNGFNEMWLIVKEAAVHLSSLLTLSWKQVQIATGKNIPFNHIFSYMTLMRQLPLEYFVPGNQMQAIFGVFAVLLPVVHAMEIDECQVKIVTTCFEILLSIFDGLRSTWFLDFVSAKDVLFWLLKSFVKYQTKVLTSKSIDRQLSGELKLIGIHFHESFMNVLIRKRNSLADVDQFLTEAEMLPNQKKDMILCAEQHASLTFSSILLKSFCKVLQQPYIPGNIVDSCCDYIYRIASHLIQWLFGIESKHYLIDKFEDEEMAKSVMDAFTVFLNCAGSNKLGPVLDNIKRWKKLIPYMIKLSLTVSSHSKEYVCLESSCQLLCNIIKNREVVNKYIPEEGFKDIWRAVENMVCCDHYLSPANCLVNNSNQERIVECFVTSTTDAEFSWLMHKLNEDLNMHELNFLSPDKIKVALCMWGNIISIPLKDNKEIAFVEVSGEFLILCQYILRDVDYQNEESLLISALVLKAEATLIKNTKMTSERLALCLQGCAFMDLLLINDSIFENIFHAVCLLLNNILMYQQSLIVGHIAEYLGVLQNLINAILHKGQQHSLKNADNKTVSMICSCAQDVERLLNKIKTFKVDFANVAPYILIHFIVESSNVTLYPAVKTHVTEGMYATLDLCDDKAISSLQLLLNPTGLQIFTSLYDNYKTYYKYQGRI